MFCLTNFSLSASAASDNLISSDLTTWTDLSDVDSFYAPSAVYESNNVYEVVFGPGPNSAFTAGLIGDSSLIAGHSYTLSFKMPDRYDVNDAFNESYQSGYLKNQFNKFELRVCLGFLDSNNELEVTSDNFIFFTVDSSNWGNFFGNTLTASFVAPGNTGTPYIVLIGVGLDDNEHYVYFSDFKLVDNDDNSKELTGIKGFLHSIRWDLVGGTCDEDDCPHSTGDNPHLSLTERITAGFSSMFQNIGNKFEEGSTLNIWFNSLSEKIGNVDLSLDNLGERISGFFSSLGDRISGFFVNLGTDLKLKLNEIGENITSKFQEIGDKFSEFFEKFKPRVYIDLHWQRGMVQANSGVPFMSNSDNMPRVVTSDLFTVSSDAVFYIDYIPISANNAYAMIFQYDMQGNYIGKLHQSSQAYTGYILPSGYQYRFQVQWYQNIEVDDSAVNEHFSLYAEEGWLNAMLWNIKTGLKGLFVPNENQVIEWKENLNLLLKDHLGIIYTCSDLITDTLNMVFDIVFDAPDTYEIKIPEVSFNVSGVNVPVFTSQNIDFSFMEKPVFKTMYRMYTVAMYFFFGALEVKYALRTYRKVMSN